MQLYEKTLRLAQEAYSFKRYLKMKRFLRVIAFILMAPFIAIFTLMLGFLFLDAIFFQLVSSPIQFLHSIIKKERDEVNFGVQIVLYVLSWPLMFLFYVLYAFVLLLFYFDYFLVVCLGYVATLAGFKFHISIAEEDITKNLPDREFVKPIIQLVIWGIFFVVGLTLGIVVFYNLWYYRLEDTFFIEFLPDIYAIVGGYLGVTAIFVPIAYRSKKEEEAPEEEAE